MQIYRSRVDGEWKNDAGESVPVKKGDAVALTPSEFYGNEGKFDWPRAEDQAVAKAPEAAKPTGTSVRGSRR